MIFPGAIITALALVSCASAADISANSALGRHLLAHATQEGRQLDEQDDSFLNSYSVKFQGCHHVQQWNDDADEEDDVRIMTKRLARFRLCPSDQCSNERSAGCNSKYGDYVVDMDTFVQAYLQALQEDNGEFCEGVQTDCFSTCEYDDDCKSRCYGAYSAEHCLQDENGNDNGFDAAQYAECQQFDLPNNNNGRRKLEDAAVEYFVGAYCANQGGEIRLGMFSDDTCTTFVNNGDNLFYNSMGFSLPYSSSSLVSTRCLGCADNQNDNNNNDGQEQTKEVCSNVYALAGKCETRMSIDYPNESSCNYIEGVKIIRDDGVIRTSSTRKSKTAAVAIGLFTTVSILLAGYVFYLRTKLARAQINLAAASQTLG